MGCQSQRESDRRYQSSQHGRLKHAEQARQYQQRHRGVTEQSPVASPKSDVHSTVATRNASTLLTPPEEMGTTLASGPTTDGAIPGFVMPHYVIAIRSPKTVQARPIHHRILSSPANMRRFIQPLTPVSWKSSAPIKSHGVPRVITIDKSGANTAAIEAYNAEQKTKIKIRQCKYLNNIVEQDHRRIKRRTRPMLGFQTFRTASIILGGIELIHMLRKGQLRNHGRSASLAQQFNSLVMA